uniref:OSJNBa0014F04.18 protein n=1 Tax=Oryza sativa subsp. japonica TaxID=39947 RepID=Q7XR29_ORYSJ|nr:OSJNBa0014F04.18 [Oryza sativa Japonica Group]
MTTTRPLELLHMDLFRPIAYLSIGGNKYGLVIVDDFSRFTWVFFLHDKSETQAIFKKFARIVQNEFDLKIKIIRSDNGKEFKNTCIESFLDEEGIKHEFSAPYLPQQNGVTERKNRTLIEMARTMLDEYKTSDRFWAEAVNTACHAINRLYLHYHLKRTPYELLTGNKPNVSYFHVFGSKCYILNKKARSSNFAPQVDEGFLFGYGSNECAYRVFNKTSGIVEIARDVTFDETNGSQVEQIDSHVLGEEEDPSEAIKRLALGDRPRQNMIGTKWIFRNKQDEARLVIRNKARLVAQGFTQIEGLDFGETIAPVARLESIRILLAFATNLNFKLYQMDVKSAFLNEPIHELVYMEQPLGLEDPKYPNHVYKLHKALYGLKQTPRACEEFSRMMTKRFEMSMMGELKLFLGLQIKQLKEGTFICQTKYLKDMLKKFGMENAKPIQTPMPSNGHLDLNEQGKDVDQKGARFDLIGYADADYAGCKVDRKSTSGTCQFLGRMPPSKQTSHKSKRPRDRSPTPSSHDDSDSDWSGGEDAVPQVALVARGGNLPPRRSTQALGAGGGGEDSSRQLQTPPHQPNVPIGPLRIHTPERDPAVIRQVYDWRRKTEVVAPWWDEDPRPLHHSATNPRFWTLFQQDFYESVIKSKAHPTVPMQWINWEELQAHNDPVLNSVIANCERMGIRSFMTLQQDWCNEVIAQFYATVFFDPHRAMHWMTQGSWYSVSYPPLAEIWGFDLHDLLNLPDLHNLPIPTNTDLLPLYIPNDPNVVLGKVDGLKPYFAYLNRMFRRSFVPKDGDASSINRLSRTVLLRRPAPQPLGTSPPLPLSRLLLLSALPLWLVSLFGLCSAEAKKNCRLRNSTKKTARDVKFLKARYYEDHHIDIPPSPPGFEAEPDELEEEEIEDPFAGSPPDFDFFVYAHGYGYPPPPPPEDPPQAPLRLSRRLIVLSFWCLDAKGRDYLSCL